ncbi:MAG: hypothetical protein OSJ70_07395 [Bacilli bacterium]|nr:hypothetical protein [Bacilli bacterium]
MKNNINIINNKLFKRQRMLVTALLAIVFVSMSVGYATYFSELNMNSTVGLVAAKTGTIDDLDIKKASVLEGANESKVQFDKAKSNEGINFSLKISSRLGFRIWQRYEVVVVNNSNINYTYMGSNAAISFKNYENIEQIIKYPVITGMLKGDVIAPGETKSIYVSFYADDASYEDFGGSYSLEANMVLSFHEGKSSIEKNKLLTSLKTTDVVLNGKKNGEVSFSLASLYDSSQVISFIVDNNDFEVVSATGGTGVTGRVLNRGASRDITAVIHLKRGIEHQHQYKIKLKIRVSYEMEGREEIYEVGEINITNDTSVEEPVEVLKNFKVNTTFNSNSWPGHATGSIEIVNNNNFEIKEWVIRLYINPNIKATQATGTQHVVEMDSEQSRLIVYSNNRYGVNHIPIGANSKLNIDGFQLTIEGIIEGTQTYYDFEVERIMVDAYYNGAWHYGMNVE